MVKKNNIVLITLLIVLLAVGVGVFFYTKKITKPAPIASVDFSSKENTFDNFKTFTAIQSVSTDPSKEGQMTEAATFLTKKLEEMGCTVKTFKEENAPALIAARYTVSGAAKTVGIYGHYDVVPEDPASEWNTKPFELTVKDGKIYGRGVSDNKGHVIQNLAAVESLIKSGTLKNNIVFILEGEEEVGSKNFEKLATEAKEFIAADVYYIIDGQMHAKNEPQIDFGLRGLSEYELTVSTGKKDLHSGIYGNFVVNPIQAMSELFDKMKNAETNKVSIPGFYSNVKPISESDRKLYAKLEWSKEAKQKEMGVFDLVETDQEQPWISNLVYPSLEVNGITGGYTEEGFKTVIPHKALAKFSIRTVPSQEPKEITALVEKFIKNNLPEAAKYELKVVQEVPPFFTDYTDPYVQKIAKIMSEEFGTETLFSRAGGSAGAPSTLQQLFKVPFILTGFTLPDSQVHSPDENFDEDMFWKGIEVMKKMYDS